MPSEEELNTYYQGFVYSKPQANELKRQVAYTSAGARNIRENLEQIAKRPIKKLLDFGGGLGFFASALSEHYEDVTLFDIDDHARKFARGFFANRFRIVDTAAEALTHQYDAILLNQVIEHVPDPVAFLRQFRAALKQDGLLIITTPNNRSVDMFARLDVLVHYVRAVRPRALSAMAIMATDSWLCCDPPRHLFAFSERNLRLAAESAGFDHAKMATAYFDDDPYGQPKYGSQGFGSLKSSANTILHLISKVTAPLLKAIDRKRSAGTTLIGYFNN